MMTANYFYKLYFTRDNIVIVTECFKGMVDKIRYKTVEATSDKIILRTEELEYIFEYKAAGWLLVSVKSLINEDLEAVKDWLNEEITLSYDSVRETAILEISTRYSLDRSTNKKLTIHPAKCEIISDPSYKVIVQAKTVYFELCLANLQNTWFVTNIGSTKDPLS